MRKLLIATAMTAAVSIAGPALAKDASGDQPSQSGTVSLVQKRADPSVSLDRRICVLHEATTGSRLQRKECRTYGKWLKDGIDPLAR